MAVVTRKKLFSVLALLAVLAVGTGCATGGYAPSAAELTQVAQLPEGPTKDALSATAIARYVNSEMAQGTADAARGTAQAAQRQAEQERAQMTAEAQRVAEARASEAAATRQSLSAAATAQAQEFEATRQTQDLEATRTAEARNATATVESRNAQATRTAEARQATATREAATATVQAVFDNAQATAVRATAQAVERQNERERMTQPLRTFGPWALLLAGLVALALVGFYGWRLFEDRARLVRRDPDEGEPIMILSRERLALPMRQFGSYADMTQGQERAPLLAPTAAHQDGTTMRQQTSNAIQARQVGRVMEARHGGQTHKVVVVPPGKRAQSRTRAQRQEPGLLGVQAVGELAEATAAGLLPPRLAEAIETQWQEVEV